MKIIFFTVSISIRSFYAISTILLKKVKEFINYEIMKRLKNAQKLTSVQSVGAEFHQSKASGRRRIWVTGKRS